MTMFSRTVLLFVLVAAALSSAPAMAERRVALVIGNANYAHASALKNPANDANAMAGKLRDLGFDVQVGIDLDQPAFARSMEE
ncbi:MAG: caspase family protein, partial [Rhizobiales bacterium]|nr:caspase family protein [Hyphomicrobiales bacterium]